MMTSKSDSVYERGAPPDQATARLAIAIKAVCPGEGASIGRWDNRETWRLDAAPHATETQIAAAHAVMAAFDPWAVGSVFSDPVPAWREEGQPAASEIFTEEDVEALGAVAAESEAGENPGDGESAVHPTDEDAAAAPGDGAADAATDAVDDASGDGGDLSAYSGIVILPDELGARRNAVLASITAEKLTRLSIAMDPSRADFLAARFADYQNAGALGLPIDDALAADYRAFQELRDRRDRITNYAMQLEQSALDGDMERLEAMHVGLGEGWPT